MRLDLVQPACAEPRGCVTAKPVDKVLGLGGQRRLGREHERLAPVQDLLIRLLRRVRAEGRVADEHLKHNHAQRPPVARAVVSCLVEHLGCDVVRRAHRRVRHCATDAFPCLSALARRLRTTIVAGRKAAVEVGAVRLLHAGAQAEVGQLDMAVGIEQQVVWLDVAVDEAQRVDRADRQHRLRDVEPRPVFAERVVAHEHRHHVSPREKFHDQVEVDRILKAVEHLDDPLVVRLDEGVALGTHVGDLVLVQHVSLAEHLHGIDHPGVAFLHELDLASVVARRDSLVARRGTRVEQVVRGDSGKGKRAAVGGCGLNVREPADACARRVRGDWPMASQTSDDVRGPGSTKNEGTPRHDAMHPQCMACGDFTRLWMGLRGGSLRL
eukprot:m.57569 g.57569  ORF g.57569 m.57569 type:complete len:382 (+) comp6842_c0_seq1:875-2020(+)